MEAARPPTALTSTIRVDCCDDALDECEQDDIRRILPRLEEAKSLNTLQLRVFITSRPETAIRYGF